MRVADFSFELPDELIARYPTAQRNASRLLTLSGENGQLADKQLITLELFQRDYSGKNLRVGSLKFS